MKNEKEKNSVVKSDLNADVQRLLGKAIDGQLVVNVELQSRLDLLIVLRNEQLDQLVRVEVDQDFINYLCLIEPSNNDHAKRKTENDLTVIRKTKLVNVINLHVLEALKKAEKSHEQKN